MSTPAQPVADPLRLGLLVAALLLLVPLAGVQPNLYFTHDSGLYVAGAQSLTQGAGYRLLSHVGEPAIGLYPPLNSLYLAGWLGGSGDLLAAFPRLQLGQITLGAAAGVLLLRLLLRSGAGAATATGLTLAFGLSTAMLTNELTFMSEPLTVLLGLGLASVWSGSAAPDSLRHWTATGLLAGLWYLTRSATLAPVAGLGVIAFLVARRGRWGVLLAYGLPVAGAIVGWQVGGGEGAGYRANLIARANELGGLAPLARELALNAVKYGSGYYLLESLLPLPPDPHRLPLLRQGIGWLGLAALAVTALGFMAATVRGAWIDPHPRLKHGRWLALAYLGQMSLWPYLLSGRAMLLLAPFALRWAWLGGRDLLPRLPAGPAFRRVLKVWLWLSVALSAGFLPQRARHLANAPFLEELAAVTRHVSRHVPPDRLIALDQSLPAVHFHAETGRQLLADYLPRHFARVVFQPVTLEQQGDRLPDYVLATWANGYWEQLQPIARAQPGLYTIDYQSPGGLYLLLKLDPAEQRRLRQRRPAS